MKRKFLLFPLLALGTAAHAQFYVDGATIYTETGALITVKEGDFISNYDITGDGTVLMNGASAQNVNMNNGGTASTYHSVPRLELDNPSNVTLTGNSGASVDLKFTNGKLIAGNNNFNFATAATATGVTANNFIATTGTGVVYKRGMANNASFTYPVGATATNGDYTPAAVTNTAAARDIASRVQVRTGTNPTSLFSATDSSITREWKIFGSTAGTGTVSLTHIATQEHTNFNPSAAFVTQQINNGVWDKSTPVAGPLTHSRAGLNIVTDGATSYDTWFSKASGDISANAALDLVIALQGAFIGTASSTMRNDLQTYSPVLLPTTDPYGLGVSYSNINSTTGPAGAVVDWVKVEVRNAATPGTVLQTRALLLKTNGHIVDVDGKVPVFNGQAVAVRVAPKHRNHMAVLTNNVNTGAFRGQFAYDMTTGLTQASSVAGDPAQMVLRNTKWSLWAADVNQPNQDLAIDGTDYGLLNNYNKQGIADLYHIGDLNLDGSVDGTDLGTANSNNKLGIYSTLLNY